MPAPSPNQVVEVRTDTPAMLEALQAIAAFYGQEQGGNTAEARKNLRQVRWVGVSSSHVCQPAPLLKSIGQ